MPSTRLQHTGASGDTGVKIRASLVISARARGEHAPICESMYVYSSGTSCVISFFISAPYAWPISYDVPYRCRTWEQSNERWTKSTKTTPQN